MKYDVVALGELLIDFTIDGKSNQGNNTYEANPGGAPCNVLAMLNKMNKKTAFIGKVGNDAFGQILKKTIDDVGIDSKGLMFDEHVNTTLAFVNIDENGERSFSFYRNPGADMMLTEEEVDFETFSKSDFRAVKVKACEAVKKSKKLLQFTLDDGTGTDRTILSGIHAYYEPEELVGKTLIAITNLPPRKMMGIESCGMLLSAVNNLKDSEDEELHLLMVDDHIPAGAKLY